MFHFPFFPGSLYTNMRFCYEALCGYSKALCGLVTKVCPHHRQKRCFPRVKFPSVSSRLRKAWTESQDQLWKGITETLLALTSCYWMNEITYIVKSCSCPSKYFTYYGSSPEHGNSPDLQLVVSCRWSIGSPFSRPQSLRSRKLELEDVSNHHVF